jgi:hypothetical protein
MHTNSNPHLLYAVIPLLHRSIALCFSPREHTVGPSRSSLCLVGGVVGRCKGARPCIRSRVWVGSTAAGCGCFLAVGAAATGEHGRHCRTYRTPSFPAGCLGEGQPGGYGHVRRDMYWPRTRREINRIMSGLAGIGGGGVLSIMYIKRNIKHTKPHTIRRPNQYRQRTLQS